MVEPLETLKREWPVVRRAPWSFVAVLVAGFAAGAVVLGYFSSQLVSIRDAKIADCERKLGIVSPNQTAYSVLDNAQLKQRAINVVRDIRSFVSDAEGLARREFADHVAATMTRAPSKAQIDDSWRSYEPALSLRYAETHAGFAAKFKAEAMGCRNELLRRLNEPLTDTARALYESAADRREMASIADDLDRLVRSLPD